MNLLERHRPLLRFFALAAVLGIVVAVALSIGKARTVATLIPLAPPKSFASHVLPGYPTVSIALPKSWNVEPLSPRTPYGGPFLLATESGTAPRTGTSLAPTGPRKFTAEIYRPSSILPPLTFLQHAFGFRSSGQRLTVAGYPSVVIGLAANNPGDTDSDSPTPNSSSSPWTFRFIAATTLPSGDILLLRLEGPGRGADTDSQLFSRLLASISLPDSPLQSSLSSDALDALRTHPVLPPSDIARPSSRSSPYRTREHAILSTPSDILTVELFSSYLPPLPPLTADPASPPDPKTLDNLPAIAAFRDIATSHDNRFLAAIPSRISPTRTILSLPDNLATPPIMALAVYADASPNATLAAILIARGQTSSPADLARLLNRAADRLTFAPSSDDLPAFLAAGQSLATAASTLILEDVNLAFSPSATTSPPLAPFALARVLPDGTLESRRSAPAPERILRTARSIPGNQVTITTVRQIASGRQFVDVLTRTFTIPSNYLDVAPSQPDTAPAFDLLNTSRYVPGHRLLQALPLVGDTPAILVTDLVPLLDLDTQSRFSFLLVQPYPPLTTRDRKTFALQVLGTGRTLLATYDASGKLLELSMPDYARGLPVSPDQLETIESGW